MAEDPTKQDNPQNTGSDMGQMGSQNPQSGQKGGQSQTDVGTDVSQEDYSRTDTSGMEEDATSLGDEDL